MEIDVDPLKAPGIQEDFAVVFKKGLPVEVIQANRKKATVAVDIFLESNAIICRHGVGRRKN